MNGGQFRRGALSRGSAAAIIQPAGAHFGGIQGSLLDLLAVLEKAIQRLRHVQNVLKCRPELVVPVDPVMKEIVRLDHFAAGGAAAGADEGFPRVERAVVVREFLAGLNIADGDLEFIAGAEAIGLAGVIHEPGEIPAKHEPAVRVDEAVLLENGIINGPKAGQFAGVEGLVKVIANPGDRSFGNAPGSEDAVANVIVYETKFSIWMEHARCNFHPFNRV